MLIRLKETMSKKSSNKDKKNQSKGCNQSSMKNVTCKQYSEQSDKDEEHSNNGQWSMVNGLLFHMTQPTSRSIIKAIACSKPIVSEH